MSHIGTKFLLADKFIFDPTNNSLIDPSSDGDVIRLGSNESRILLMFAQKPNEVVSRDQLHEFVWRDQGFQVDDSSLTQAISTLRKTLGDSTRAPLFVKTVPKRGYQFIASVGQPDQAAKPAEQVDEDESEQLQPQAEQADGSVSDINASAKVQAQPERQKPEVLQAQTVSSAHQKLIRALVMVSVLLPLIVYLSVSPAKSQFVPVGSISSVPVFTTVDQPPMDQWTTLIESCIPLFLDHNADTVAPDRFIVTAGPRSDIRLNAIYPKAYTHKNVTLQLLVQKDEIDTLCTSKGAK